MILLRVSGVTEKYQKCHLVYQVNFPVISLSQVER